MVLMMTMVVMMRMRMVAVMFRRSTVKGAVIIMDDGSGQDNEDDGNDEDDEGEGRSHQVQVHNSP